MVDPRPVEFTFEIGRDRYGRRSRLHGERVGGNVYWSIVSDPVSQRDDGERMNDLTTEHLKAIVEVANVKI
jgi:hypothetical protein